jgi:hypothetical protein
MNKYTSEFTSMLKLEEKPYTRSYVTWTLIRRHFDQQTPSCFVCRNWTLRDQIKVSLNLPQNWRYFTIRDLYRFTDTKIVVREEQQVVSDKLDINGVYNYFESYSVDIIKSIERQTSAQSANAVSEPSLDSDYSEEDYFP